MFPGRKGKATGWLEVAAPRVVKSRQLPLASDDSVLTLVSERRRIVAQVRREVPKNRDFFAVQDSVR